MVGKAGVAQGLVSKSDLTGAISPYLRPEFSKWRRPLDEATLQIRLKWVMSKPLTCIKPDTILADIMKIMRQGNDEVLGVINHENKVKGLVTAFDIFKVIPKYLSTFAPDKSISLQIPHFPAEPHVCKAQS